MIIHVTEQDIKQGEPGMPGICPVAIAAKRAFRTRDLTVSYAYINVEAGYPGAPGIYDLPDVAADFISAFDKGLPVEPFFFELPGLT